MSERWNTGEDLHKDLRPDLQVARQDLPQNIEKAWKIFEEYSRIPPNEIETHLRAVRDKAWEIFPYPCIGQWRFLDLYITTRPEYPDVVRRIRSGDRFLDVGTCFGYVLRQLAFDGAPAQNLYGLDLEQRFIDLGFDLFRDREKLGTTFVVGDLLNPTDPGLEALDGKMDIMYAGSLFHLFPWEDQIEVGKRVIRFFRPDAPKPLLIGRQVGSFDPPPHPNDPIGCQGKTRHNPKTFQRLWDIIGEQTGTKWIVNATIKDEGDGLGIYQVMLKFSVTPAE